MGLVHGPRTVAAVCRGLARRRLSPLSDTEKALVGVGTSNPPHVYSARAGLFDVDLMLHMNNASYLTHAELARWEWTAYNGTLGANFRSQSFFIVTASFIRFRREIAPLHKFQIETRLGGIDERNLWVYQTFHYPKGDEQRGKVLAQAYTQGVITKKGKVIDPRDWLVDNIPAAKDALEELEPSNEPDALFDEKSTRFMHLEDAMRKSAALHDDEVAK
ncbi:hypothetical protein ACHAXT_003152 [Thalassiosira profunda]